jgi:hypothetical protein
MKDPKYRIEADGLDGLAAKLVYLMKLENDACSIEPNKSTPRVDIMKCVTRCGSTVRISLTRKPADPNARSGIEIDGARLG